MDLRSQLVSVLEGKYMVSAGAGSGVCFLQAAIRISKKRKRKGNLKECMLGFWIRLEMESKVKYKASVFLYFFFGV
jgi:hypothetical protein